MTTDDNAVESSVLRRLKFLLIVLLLEVNAISLITLSLLTMVAIAMALLLTILVDLDALTAIGTAMGISDVPDDGILLRFRLSFDIACWAISLP